MNTTFRDISSDAIKYWEVRRIIYNAVLAIIALGYFIYALPSSLHKLSFDSFLGFFVLAVIANVCYCAIYLPDFLAQISVFQSQWRRYRWILFLIGLILHLFLRNGSLYPLSALTGSATEDRTRRCS